MLPELLGASASYAEGKGTRAGRTRHATVSVKRDRSDPSETTISEPIANPAMLHVALRIWPVGLDFGRLMPGIDTSQTS